MIGSDRHAGDVRWRRPQTVAERLHLDAATRDLLRSPMREYHFAIPIRVGGPACDGDCPHDDAAAWWSEALDVYGKRAHELRFLRAHGANHRVVEARL